MSSLPDLALPAQPGLNSVKHQPKNPKSYVSMADYQSRKNEKLRELKSQSDQHKQLCVELGFRNRQHQLRKGRQMSAGNPLAVDQAVEWERKRSRLMQKYAFKLC
jgi:hypothetical protein